MLRAELPGDDDGAVAGAESLRVDDVHRAGIGVARAATATHPRAAATGSSAAARTPAAGSGTSDRTFRVPSVPVGGSRAVGGRVVAAVAPGGLRASRRLDQRRGARTGSTPPASPDETLPPLPPAKPAAAHDAAPPPPPATTIRSVTAVPFLRRSGGAATTTTGLRRQQCSTAGSIEASTSYHSARGHLQRHRRRH